VAPTDEPIRGALRDRHGRPVACVLFGSAAWQCADRDAFLGWDRATRERNLQGLTNNTRFLPDNATARGPFGVGEASAKQGERPRPGLRQECENDAAGAAPFPCHPRHSA
jgi:hypothetical protein